MDVHEIRLPITLRPATGVTLSYSALLPLCFSVVLVLLYLWIKPGFLASDDLEYAELATTVMTGQFQPAPHHFSNRFGVFLPTALSYALFGVNAYTTTLWPLVAALLLALAIFYVTQRWFGVLPAALAMFLFVTNPLLLNQIAYLLPDLPVGLFIFGAFIFLLAARRAQRDTPRLKNVVGVCLFVTLAILTKETAVWVLYFAALLLLFDMAQRQHRKTWLWLGIGGVIIAGVYLLFYYLATGDALFRLKGIEGGHNLSLWSYIGGRAGSLAHRLTYGPLDLLIQERGLFFPLALTLPWLMLLRQRHTHYLTARDFILFGLAIVLSFWFGTTSLKAYNPLPLIPRMLTPVVPVLVIPAAFVIHRLYFFSKESTQRYLPLAMLSALLLLGGSVYSFLLLDNTPKLYPAAALLLLLPYFHKYAPAVVRKQFVPFCGLGLLAVIACFPIPHILHSEFGETLHQKAEITSIQRMLDEMPPDAHVVTSSRSARVISYYQGLAEVQSAKLVIWENNPALATTMRPPFFVYFNETRESWLATAYEDASFADFVKHNRATWDLVIQDGSISLFLAR